jgi:metallo-beta-lactamase family protein
VNICGTVERINTGVGKSKVRLALADYFQRGSDVPREEWSAGLDRSAKREHSSRIPVKLQFLGANRQVTGSQYYLRVGQTRLLIDCGMFQERQYLDRNWEPLPVPPREIDALLLTHAHLDHCGLIPKLVRDGFRGKIYTTAASADLAEIILRDSAHIQVEDAAYKKKRHRKEGRTGKHPEIPLYDETDVERALPYFQPIPYHEPIQLNGVTARFLDAGHVLGSAFLVLDAVENGRRRRIVFSGDLGMRDRPILRDPETIDQVDYLIIESTYGDREHDHGPSVMEQLTRVVKETSARGGHVVIPVFALERAQELLFYFSRLYREGKLPPLPIFLDSPMAVRITEVFRRHRECLDEETQALIDADESPFSFPNLHLVSTVEESKQINTMTVPSVIMATSGMCTAGRIKFHLRHNIVRPESTILFVGYQARGTLGRQILDGNPQVRIHGKEWPTRARIEQIHGLSGHADRPALLSWLSEIKQPPKSVFITHGEENASLSFAETLRSRFGWRASVPEYMDEVELE